MKSIPEGLGDVFKVLFIARKSKEQKSHQIKLNKIKVSSNIFSYLTSVFKTLKQKDTNYLLLSITPYTFFAYLLLFIFRKKVFIYLRSNGYEEYKSILGFLGPKIYHVMYVLVTLKSNIITCQKRLVKKKRYDLVFPSELDINWIQNTTKPLLDKPRLLYVGRLKVEKGIFSLIKMFDEMTNRYELSIVGKTDDKFKNKYSKKINFLGHGYNAPQIIKIYNNHNISNLPSFTEAHPKVVDESLARARPVIIFEEINHIINERKGIFVAKRNVLSLTETIEFIMKNYLSIQNEITKNKLSTKEEFISKMTNILY